MPIKYPRTAEKLFLSYCSVSPLYGLEAATEILNGQSLKGRNFYPQVVEIISRFHRSVAKLLKTSPANISFVRNTAEGLSLVANGYPFKAGEEIISFVHEYPSDHYPWVLQAEKRGVKLKLLPNTRVDPDLPEGLVGGWSFEDLESMITDRTRLLAISHVQFTSGFAADLLRLGEFCKARQIDLVIDAAQSIGSLPLYPEEFGISAIAASGWKWLMGPMGTGVFYTSPALREKLSITVCGADNMQQSPNYLDHSFTPFDDGRKFEYGPAPFSCLAALTKSIEDIQLSTTPETIRDRIFELQNTAISLLDSRYLRPHRVPEKNRSGICSVYPLCKNLDEAAKLVSAEAEAQGIIVTPRDGYLRVAPHFFNTESEVEKGIDILNNAASKVLA